MKKHVVLLSLWALLVLPAIADETVDDCFDMAKNFFEAGDYTSAKEYADNVLKINPSHFGAKCLMIKLTPPGVCQGKRNIDTQIIIRPQNTFTGCRQSDEYNLKGEDYYNNHDYNNAKDAFLCAIKYNLSNMYAYNNLGLTYWKLENFRKAEQYFKKANNLNSSFTTPLDNLAQMCIENCQYKKARKYLNRAVLENKKDYCAYYLLGILDKKECKYPNAIKNLNTATQISDEFPLSYLQLADIYYITKDYSWANSSIEKYVELSPEDDYAYYMLYKNYLALKDYNAAKNYIVKAILMKNCVEYRIALADVENLLDNPKSAIDALKSIPAPKAETLNDMGQYYLRLNDSKNALKCFHKASMKPYARPIYLYNAALVYKNIGDVDNYKKTMAELESIKPKTYQDYIDLSGIYLDCANKNKAIAILNRGIRVCPKNKELYDAKIKVYTLTSDKDGITFTQKEMNKVFKNET